MDSFHFTEEYERAETIRTLTDSLRYLNDLARERVDVNPPIADINHIRTTMKYILYNIQAISKKISVEPVKDDA